MLENRPHVKIVRADIGPGEELVRSSGLGWLADRYGALLDQYEFLMCFVRGSYLLGMDHAWTVENFMRNQFSAIHMEKLDVPQGIAGARFERLSDE